MIVLLTVRLSVPLKERLGAQLTLTLGTDEVLGVPRLA